MPTDKSKRILVALAILVLLGALAPTGAGQETAVSDKDLGPRVRERLGSRRRALVIGINDYQDAAIEDLRFAEADAQAVHEILVDPLRGGFATGDVTLLLGNQATTRNMRIALDDLAKSADDETFVLLFFSGHGVNLGGEACWVTQDAEAAHLGATAVTNDMLRKWLDGVRSKRLVVLVDACHAAATLKTGEKALPSVEDLQKLYRGEGRVILNSCDPKQKSHEDASLGHGIFTAALRDALMGRADEAGNRDGVNSMDEVWAYVSRDVTGRAGKLGKTQTPVRITEDEKATDRFLVTVNVERLRSLEEARRAGAATTKRRVEFLKNLLHDDLISGAAFDEGRRLLTADPEALSPVEGRFRAMYESLAEGRLEPSLLEATRAGIAAKHGNTPPPSPAAPSPDVAKPPGPPPSTPRRAPAFCVVIRSEPDPAVVTDADIRRRIEATGLAWHVRHTATGIEFLLVPPGEYMRGASPGDGEAHGNEKPAHRVRITKAFYLGRYEMTQGEWKKATGGSNPSQLKRSDRHPVETVSHTTVTEVARSLGCRLPAEAEWEYAGRAGTTESRYGNLDDVAWYYQNSGATTHPVGEKRANALGFHDMLGNVWEWCSDGYAEDAYRSCAGGVADPQGPSSGGSRLLRGGSWIYDPRLCRVSHRGRIDPALESYDVGVRLAMDP